MELPQICPKQFWLYPYPSQIHTQAKPLDTKAKPHFIPLNYLSDVLIN